jgi:hypothetical protein
VAGPPHARWRFIRLQAWCRYRASAPAYRRSPKCRKEDRDRNAGPAGASLHRPATRPRVAPLLRSRAPTAQSVQRVLFSQRRASKSPETAAAGIPGLQPFRLQGFSPSWRLSPLPNLAGLFHPASTPGVRPSELFPRVQCQYLVRTGCPPGVIARGDRLQGFDPQPSPWIPRRRFRSAWNLDALLVFCPFRA